LWGGTPLTPKGGNKMKWTDYNNGKINVDIWLRISTTGEYLNEDYLDKRELFEYLNAWVEA